VPRPKDKRTDFEAVARAVGKWPWRQDWIRETTGKPISEKMISLLALIVFESYELFPAHESRRKPSK
jgi:hypothetical protein